MSDTATAEATTAFTQPIKAAAQPWGHWLHDLPARTAFRLTRSPPVSRFLSSRYDRARSRYRAKLPSLSGIDLSVAEALHRDGFCMTSLEALHLPDGEKMLQSAQDLVRHFAEEAKCQAARGKDFLLVSGDAITQHPLLFTWGLSDRLLDIAESYLEMPVAYDGLQIAYTVADGREVSTRRWHRDWEDRRMLKVAIYLNNVDLEGGPMEAIIGPPRSDEEPFEYALYSDDDITRLMGTSNRVACTGSVGTVILIDTARHYHRGRPAIRSDRGAIFYSYVAYRPRHPFFCERSGLSRAQTMRLSQQLTGRQRQAALWRRRLPALIRLIPSARV